MFKVNPVRKVEFTATHDDGLGNEDSVIDYKVVFDFVIAETYDYGQLRELLADKTPVKLLETDGKPKKDPKTGEVVSTQGELNCYYFVLRTSLVHWENICDMDGNPLPVRDENGIIKENQKAVFEAIRRDKELFEKIQTAYVGFKSKN